MEAIKQAFEILSKELGDSFKFKGELEKFTASIMSGNFKFKQFADMVKGIYPNAKLINFRGEYDSINRFNRLLDYFIQGDDGTIATDDQLRVLNEQLHSDIFDFLSDVLLADYIEINDFEDEGVEFLFDLCTLDWDEIDSEEED